MPEIKYEASMTEYYGFILAAARTIYNQDKEVRAFINDSTPTCLRGCLRKNHGDCYHGTLNKETRFDCSPKGIRIQIDGNYIILSWSQMTKFMQDNKEAVSESEDENIQSTKIISTPEYNRAVAVNSRISAHALAMQDNLFEVCKGLKEMRDDKLYKELGYKNFEEYCKAEHGISDRQGRKMLSIIDSNILENRNSSSAFGVTKLYLLSRLTDEEREEITENNDVESMTVKELKNEIKGLKSQLELAEFHKKQSAEAFDKVANASKTNREKYDAERAKTYKLEERIRELESRPIDVAVEVDHDEVDRRVTAAMLKVNHETEQLIARERQDNAEEVRQKNEIIYKLREELDELRSSQSALETCFFLVKMTVDDWTKFSDSLSGTPWAHAIKRARMLKGE